MLHSGSTRDPGSLHHATPPRRDSCATGHPRAASGLLLSVIDFGRHHFLLKHDVASASASHPRDMLVFDKAILAPKSRSWNCRLWGGITADEGHEARVERERCMLVFSPMGVATLWNSLSRVGFPFLCICWFLNRASERHSLGLVCT